MSHEMEMEDFLVELKRKLAVVEEQNQALREQNSRLTLALDEALGWVRQLRAERRQDLAGGVEL
jgi:predicted nuclease with TOPRIM domain